ncbi:MAG TPA: T9SS type A sorting domain-containing protein [Ignavibacteriales bacterium]|nr:T9SS type A sorting domain-containing protein [Ignavibacteriales bacterium]
MKGIRQTIILTQSIVLLAVFFLPLKLNAQLNGNKTIDPYGSGPDNYRTFSEAIQALNNEGTTRGVTFLIASGTYNEPKPLRIDISNNKPTQDYRVIFKPAPGATVQLNVLGQDTSLFAVRIGRPGESTDYVTIDGSNSGATRDMTIIAADPKYGTQPVDIYGDNITIKNCIIQAKGRGNIWTDEDMGIILRNSAPTANYCLIENNKVSSINAIILGKDTLNVQTGNVIRGNEVHFYHKGIYAYKTSDVVIEGNEIIGDLLNQYQLLLVFGIHVGTPQGNSMKIFVNRNNIHNLGTNSGTTGAKRVRGIHTYGPGEFLINGNRIHELFNATKDTTNFQPSVFGIQLEGGNVTSLYRIYNNAIYGFKDADNINGRMGTILTTGIDVPTAGSVEVYNNTVYIEETERDYHETQCIYIGPMTPGSMIDLKNNIFYNGNSSPNARSWAVYRTSAMKGSMVSDFNLFYADGVQNSFLAFSGKEIRSTIKDWKSSTSWDLHSISMDPGFSSPSEVSILPGKWVVNGQGRPNLLVYEDIDGNYRSNRIDGGGCDIGAFEYTPVGFAATTMQGTIGIDTTVFTGVDGKKVAEIVWSGTQLPDQVELIYTPGQRATVNSGGLSNKGIDNMYSFNFPGNAGSGWTADVRLYYNEETEIRDYIEQELVVNKRPVSGDGMWDVEASAIDQVLHCAKFRTNALGTYTLVDKNLSPLPVEKSTAAKFSYALEQNYPNPFNPETKIKFSLSEEGKVRLTLFNSIGQAVKVLLDEMKTKGSHEVILSAGELPSGVYFYRLESRGFRDTKKLVIMK